jgi:hypothetical protein
MYAEFSGKSPSKTSLGGLRRGYFKKSGNMRSEIRIAVVMKIEGFWDMPCRRVQS